MDSAWIELDCHETWKRFDERFRFQPSTGPFFLGLGRGIMKPSPSETYAFGHIFDRDGVRYTELNNDLMAFALAMFRDLVADGDWIYALDWQHQSYQFFPHLSFALDEFGEWPVPILPDGDYYIFLERDFSWGIFGHPWEQTMCFWGDEVLSYLHTNRPKLFSDPARKK